MVAYITIARATALCSFAYMRIALHSKEDHNSGTSNTPSALQLSEVTQTAAMEITTQPVVLTKCTLYHFPSSAVNTWRANPSAHPQRKRGHKERLLRRLQTSLGYGQPTALHPAGFKVLAIDPKAQLGPFWDHRHGFLQKLGMPQVF